MLVVTVLFLVLLTVAHVGDPEAAHRPLSLFREVNPLLGYPLFALLAFAGGFHLRTYYRLGRSPLAPAASLALLVAVAVTPSPDAGHNVAAFALLGLVFGWYAVRLYLVSSPWLIAHLAVPLLLVNAGSYGAWQKLTVIYFLLAANLDCLLAAGRLVLPGPEHFVRKRGPEGRRRYSPRVLWRRTDQRVVRDERRAHRTDTGSG